MAGLELDGDYRLDLGADGRLESNVNGFISNDLKLQTLELMEVKVGKDKRVQNFDSYRLTVQTSIPSRKCGARSKRFCAPLRHARKTPYTKPLALP